MKHIPKRKGVRVLSYMLQYLKEEHKLFSICTSFEPGRYTIKAVNAKSTYESVIAVCQTRKMAKEIINLDLQGVVVK